MSRTACYVTTACVCESECDIHTCMHYAVCIYTYILTIRSKGGRELGPSGERRVGGGGGAATASAWHCHFQGERAARHLQM